MVGTDPLHSSPILDLRIRKAIRRNGARLAVATDRPTALDGGAEAVARYTPGAAAGFLAELGRALRDDADERRRAASPSVLRDAENVVIVWGERIGREGGGGPGAARCRRASISTQGRVGTAGSPRALERPRPARGRLPPRRRAGAGEAAAGRATEEIRAVLESGELKTLVLFGVDPLRDFPDTEAWKGALAAADHIVVFSTFENATTAIADVVFPLETHAEKDGTVTHPEGRLQRVRPAARRPGDIRPNWGVLAELSLALGHDTGISSQPSAFPALTEAVPFYAGIQMRTSAGVEFAGRTAPRRPRMRRPWRGVRAGSPDTQREAPPATGCRTPPLDRVSPGDVPRSLGGADHGIQSAVAVPRAAAAGRAVGR